jgi:hypothetical protein
MFSGARRGPAPQTLPPCKSRLEGSTRVVSWQWLQSTEDKILSRQARDAKQACEAPAACMPKRWPG